MTVQVLHAAFVDIVSRTQWQQNKTKSTIIERYLFELYCRFAALTFKALARRKVRGLLLSLYSQRCVLHLFDLIKVRVSG